MTWTAYGTFLVFAVLLILVPGQDFVVVTRNTLTGGRWRGRWTATGVGMSNAVQGTAAAVGLGALIVRSQPLFQAIKWAGIGYLAYLGVRSLISAVRGRYTPLADDAAPRPTGAALSGWRQGFLSNITNPKVLVFYLSVLPQFLTPTTGAWVLVLFALTHATLSLAYLTLLTGLLHRARRLLSRRPVRRALDTATGIALLGFGAKLATGHN